MFIFMMTDIKKFVGLPEGYRMRCKEIRPHIYECEAKSSAYFDEKEDVFFHNIMIELKDLYELGDYDYVKYIEKHPDKIAKALEETIIEELSKRFGECIEETKLSTEVKCYVPRTELADYITATCSVKLREPSYVDNIREVIRTLDDIYEESVDADTRWEFAENLVDKAKEL